MWRRPCLWLVEVVFSWTTVPLSPVGLDHSIWQKQRNGKTELLSWKCEGLHHQTATTPSNNCSAHPAELTLWGALSLLLPLSPGSIKLQLLVGNICKLCDLFFVMGLNLTPFTLTFLNRELLVPKGIQCSLQLTQLIAQSQHLMWHLASWKPNWLLNIYFRVEFVMMELLVQSKPGMWIPGLYVKILAGIRDSWIKLQTQRLPFSLSRNFPFSLFMR